MKYRRTAIFVGLAGVVALGTTSAVAQLTPESTIQVTIPLSCVDSQGVVVLRYNILEITGKTRTPIPDKGYVKGQLTYFDASGGENVRQLTPEVRAYYNDGKRKVYSESVPIGNRCE